jgi:hypothetical protein
VLAQLVEHRTAHALRSVSLELDALRFFITTDCTHQAYQPGLDQVGQLHAGGQPRYQMMCDAFHHR